MESLMREHRFFGVLELQTCNRVFHAGAKWSVGNSGNEIQRE
jgi:hypothetical protein